MGFGIHGRSVVSAVFFRGPEAVGSNQACVKKVIH